MSFFDPNKGPPTPPPEFTDLYYMVGVPAMMAVLMLIDTIFGVFGLIAFVWLWLRMCKLIEQSEGE